MSTKFKMSQELQYLREEMNQRINFFYEHSQKTIHIVLLIWGGFLTFFGISEIDFKDTPFYFIGGTILFISNLILYFSTQRGHDNLNQIFKIAAYITVFYEKRPSKTIRVRDNFCWEITTFEIQAKEADSKTKDKKRIYEMNGEYMALLILSILGIVFFTAMLYVSCGYKEIFLFSICYLYSVISLFLFKGTMKYSSLKNIADIKITHLNNFIQYSRETEHYTDDEIEKQFGIFREKLKYFEANPTAKIAEGEPVV